MLELGDLCKLKDKRFGLRLVVLDVINTDGSVVTHSFFDVKKKTRFYGASLVKADTLDVMEFICLTQESRAV